MILSLGIFREFENSVFRNPQNQIRGIYFSFFFSKVLKICKDSENYLCQNVKIKNLRYKKILTKKINAKILANNFIFKYVSVTTVAILKL